MKTGNVLLQRKATPCVKGRGAGAEDGVQRDTKALALVDELILREAGIGIVGPDGHVAIGVRFDVSGNVFRCRVSRRIALLSHKANDLAADLFLNVPDYYSPRY